jgi:DNA invertase Pin-like site-specific DNA recombinase
MIIGYARVSTADQSLAAQTDSLTAADVERIFADKITGTARQRPELDRMLDQLRPGDVVVVAKYDRLARSLHDLLDIVKTVQEAGAGFRSLAEDIDTTTPAGRLVFHVFASIAQFERERISETDTRRPRSGQAKARPGWRTPSCPIDGSESRSTPDARRRRQERARDRETLPGEPGDGAAGIGRRRRSVRMTRYDGIPPDPAGKERALRKAAMPESLLIPIAAVDEDAIRRHVGPTCEAVSGTRPGNALRVIAECGPEPSGLLVWQHERAEIINKPIQLWVDATYTGYRKAYRTVFPQEEIGKTVIHHIMNRRYALIHGFRYLRVISISRSANSSSGFSENWGVKLTLAKILRSRVGEASISYADLAHLMSMLDMPVGGGVMENVRLAADLLRPPKA